MAGWGGRLNIWPVPVALRLFCLFFASFETKRGLGGVRAESTSTLVTLLIGNIFLSIHYRPGIVLGPFQSIVHSILSHFSIVFPICNWRSRFRKVNVK